MTLMTHSDASRLPIAASEKVYSFTLRLWETDVIASLPDGQVSPEPFSGGRVVTSNLT
jgi:hypothetical protein